MALALEAFIRHAEQFGVEGVYEVAVDALPLAELANLVAHLRRIDKERRDDETHRRVRHRIEPVWSLTNDQKEELGLSLLTAGYSAPTIAKKLGVARSTVNKYRSVVA